MKAQVKQLHHGEHHRQEIPGHGQTLHPEQPIHPSRLHSFLGYKNLNGFENNFTLAKIA